MFRGDVLRNCDANLRNADGEKPPFERKGFRVRNGFPQVLGVEAELARRLVVADVERGERVVVEFKEIEGVFHHALRDEDVGDLAAERLQVERIAAREMLEPAA